VDVNPTPPAEAARDSTCPNGRSLRALLARRLARANKPEVAARYFTGETAAHYAAYIADTRLGFDISQPAEKRAAAFWRAAQNVRKNGMDLLGTELEPDFAIWNGDFTYDAVTPAREGRVSLEGGLSAPTPDELKRVKRTAPPENRFHYRCRAADLAWWAASLMPNDSDATAAVLHEAGGWLRRRDPQAANRFYHALLIRCGNTALAQSARAKNWFLDTQKPETSSEINEEKPPRK
jgi:hypothetical protein